MRLNNTGRVQPEICISKLLRSNETCYDGRSIICHGWNAVEPRLKRPSNRVTAEIAFALALLLSKAVLPILSHLPRSNLKAKRFTVSDRDGGEGEGLLDSRKPSF